MLCDDPFVAYVKSLGYNMLRVPTELYEPLRLLESDGRKTLRVVGSLGHDTVSDLGENPPAIQRDIDIADVSFRRTRKLRAQAALPVVTTLLEAVGLSGKISSSLSAAHSTTISLRNVTSDRVDPLQVMAFLEAGVEPSSTYMGTIGAAGRLYLVTATLKTNAFSLSLETKQAKEIAGHLDVHLPGIDLSAEAVNDHEMHVTVSGDKVLSFAFQALKLKVESGIFVGYAHVSGAVGYASPVAGTPLPMLTLEDDLVDSEDSQ